MRKKGLPAVRQGFTLIEIIITITIMAIALSAFFLISQSSQLRSDINAQTIEIVADLRFLQSNAKSGSTDFNGMHLESDQYTLFSGSAYNPTDPLNEENSLPSEIIIQNINLNTSATDLIFDGPKGTTNQYGSFQIFSTRINKANTININELGNVSY